MYAWGRESCSVTSKRTRPLAAPKRDSVCRRVKTPFEEFVFRAQDLQLRISFEKNLFHIRSVMPVLPERALPQQPSLAKLPPTPLQSSGTISTFEADVAFQDSLQVQCKASQCIQTITAPSDVITLAKLLHRSAATRVSLASCRSLFQHANCRAASFRGSRWTEKLFRENVSTLRVFSSTSIRIDTIYSVTAALGWGKLREIITLIEDPKSMLSCAGEEVQGKRIFRKMRPLQRADNLLDSPGALLAYVLPSKMWMQFRLRSRK